MAWMSPPLILSKRCTTVPNPLASGRTVESMKMSRLNQVIEQIVNETRFSGVIYVKLDGNVDFENAYGYADRSNKIPNTVDTRFGIASGTKFLTALGIGTLIDRGELSLTSRLCDCVDIDFPNISEDVAIHHLLTHTSGVYDYYDEELVEDIDNFQLDIPCFELRGPKDYIPLFRDGKMKFNPGERFSYSNGGFILLGIVIEEISGVPYTDFIQDNIFELCEMSDSGFFAMDRLPERTAFGYIDGEDGWRTNIFNLPIVGSPDAGAFTTVRDMDRLWGAFFEGKVLSKQLTNLFLEKAVKDKDNRFYGHGIWIDHKGGKDPIHYLIGWDAGVSFKSTCPSKDSIITVISNTSAGAWAIDCAIMKQLKFM